MWKGLRDIFGFTLAGKHLVLMNDHAQSIKIGHKEALEKLEIQPESITQGTCYSHLMGPHGGMTKNKTKLVKTKPEWTEKDMKKLYQDHIKADVKHIHEIPSGLASYVLLTLFSLLCAKWNKNSQETWVNWLRYYWHAAEAQWSRASIPPGLPHHNQGLERLNLELKKYLDRRRFVFNVFTCQLCSFVKEQSQYEVGTIWPKFSPTITPQDWRDAQEYMKSERGEEEVRVLCTKRANAVLFLRKKAYEKLATEAQNDTSNPHPRRIPGKGSKNPKFHDEVTARAQKLAERWESAFLGEDDSALKQLKFSEAIELLNCFNLVEQLREGEKTDAVQFSCSCFAYNHKGSRIGYQQKRHCMHVLSHGIKENVVNIPDELNIGVVAACPPPHRTASAGKALELDEY